MLRRAVILRSAFESASPVTDAADAARRTLIDLISRQWRSMSVEHMTVDAAGACLRDMPVGSDDVVFFMLSEMQDVPAFEQWSADLAGRFDRPLLLAVANDRRHADLYDESLSPIPCRTICVDELRPETLRLAMNEALAERVRQALTMNRALQRSLAKPPAREDDLAPTMVLSRTPEGITASSPHEIGPETDPFEVRIPGFRMVSYLASGGMADVFLARRTASREDVVVKVVYTKRCEDPNVLKRFIQEFTLVSRMRSPHVVEIHERGFTPQFAYIAMEYFPMGDLAQHIADGITPAMAVDYARQIAHGLRDIHRLGIVHRDLKPRNVLFRKDGTLAITDFGIAKVHGAMLKLTLNNTLVGTPYYTSPEVILDAVVDHRADLYSLGVVLFEMLTGKKAYAASNLPDLLEAHVRGDVPRLPQELDQYQPILNRLMAKAPEQRFRNAEEVIEALAALDATPLAPIDRDD